MMRMIEETIKIVVLVFFGFWASVLLHFFWKSLVYPILMNYFVLVPAIMKDKRLPDFLHKKGWKILRLGGISTDSEKSGHWKLWMEIGEDKEKEEKYPWERDVWTTCGSIYFKPSTNYLYLDLVRVSGNINDLLKGDE